MRENRVEVLLLGEWRRGTISQVLGTHIGVILDEEVMIHGHKSDRVFTNVALIKFIDE